jgi:hypothetical protein
LNSTLKFYCLGIPVKHHESMPYEKAVTYATLISDFHMKAKKCLRELLTGTEVKKIFIHVMTRLFVVSMMFT